jgi:hypothetical protein
VIDDDPKCMKRRQEQKIKSDDPGGVRVSKWFASQMYHTSKEAYINK